MSSAGHRLVLDRVTVEYGPAVALRKADLTVEPGERVAVVGLSGAGKSTLLGTFNGMVRPASGRVVTCGTELDGLSGKTLRALRSRVGFIHQHLNLVPNLSVLDNVVMGRLGGMSFLTSLRALAIPSRRVQVEVHAVLERVGIADKLFERVDRLSGGERQRVSIARALYQQPDVLLADEPVSNVDPARARSVLELLTALAVEGRLSLVVSLHNLDLAWEYFPRIVGMRSGRIVFDRPAGQIAPGEYTTLFQL